MYNRKYKSNLTIIVPFYNQQAITKQCIDDLSNLDGRHEVILIDNGSIEKTSSYIEGYVKNKKTTGVIFKYHRNSENLGFAKGLNVGYNLARSGKILFLNNDIRVGNNNLHNWTDVILNSEDDILYSQNGGIIDKNFKFVRETSNPNDSFNYLSGWFLWSNWETFDRLAKDINQTGPFKEFTLAYFEDTYMGFQARALNIPMKVVSGINVFHLGKSTSKTMNLSELYLSSRQKFIELCKERNYIP